MSQNILYFALEMQKALDDNNCKTGWWLLTTKECLTRIRQELTEVKDAIEQNKSCKEVKSECADVANFLMFLSHNYEPEKKKTKKK